MFFAKIKKAMKSKTGKLSAGMLTTAISSIILLVVLFQLYATLMPTAQAAGDTLNTSGVPLGSLFAGSGVVFVIIMAALIISVVGAFMKRK